MVSALLASVICATAGTASAAPTRVVFAGDNSIYTMKADGSGRAKLTDGNPFGEGPIVDDEPRWTPDGRTIVFQRLVVDNPFGVPDPPNEVARIWVMRADGSRQHALLPDPGKNTDHYLSGIDPRGRVIVQRRHWDKGTRRVRLSLFKVDLNGRNRRVLPEGTPVGELSPDGKRVLETDWDADKNYFWHPSIYLSRADGSDRRRIAKDAGYGTWSPDGKRIAFMSVRDRNGTFCEGDYCDWNGEIYTARADGSARRRLTFSKADDQHPTWSPDGKRIAFQSDRNFPNHYNTEVYSIGADGSCLTWLTNGAIASERPRWRPRPRESDPGGCGAAGREFAIDVDTSDLDRPRGFPVYWLGRGIGGGIFLTDVTVQFGHVDLYYWDCGFFDPRHCVDREDYVHNEDGCAWTEALLRHGRPQELTVRRGALVSAHGPGREAGDDPMVWSGGTTMQVGGGHESVDALRRYPRTLPPAGDLPPAAFPGWFYDKLSEAEEGYERTGSDEAAAAELGISKGAVKRRRQLAARLRELGVDERQRCPNPFGDG